MQFLYCITLVFLCINTIIIGVPYVDVVENGQVKQKLTLITVSTV